MSRPLLSYEIDACARAAHEANRAYSRTLGDDSHEPWEAASEHQQRSARLDVIALLSDNVTPEKSHELWMQEKLAAGFRYGAVKDETAKTHPCLVPYAELADEQRAKDALFVSVVKAMMTALLHVPQ